MKVTEGDRLVIESERVGQPPRKGTIEEVLSHDPLRVRVRWEDDREDNRRGDCRHVNRRIPRPEMKCERDAGESCKGCVSY